MVRYDAEHKATTRRRIVERAGRRLKCGGIDGSGVAALMSDAGLTNGAFYAHFASKDDLVATVVADQLDIQAKTLTALPPGRPALEAFVRAYLSPEHRDDPGAGCPSAALLDEIGRSSEAIRGIYTDGARRIIDHIAAHLDAHNPLAARKAALGLYTMLVATVQLARAVSDPDLSNEILQSGVDNALHMMAAPTEGLSRAPAV
jgi:TetR/AcrR family transcriptional regulator, transcriptional repressor for nem operon